MGIFDLPVAWVYVIYENGNEENVGNQDILSEKDAEWFKSRWDTPKNKVRRVELRINKDVVKSYKFS